MPKEIRHVCPTCLLTYPTCGRKRKPTNTEEGYCRYPWQPKAGLLERQAGIKPAVLAQRAPDVCCNEPSCDFVSSQYVKCEACGRSCVGCKFNPIPVKGGKQA